MFIYSPHHQKAESFSMKTLNKRKIFLVVPLVVVPNKAQVSIIISLGFLSLVRMALSLCFLF